MELAIALSRYAHALGRWQAAWRFASPELRRAVALAKISAAWDVFRRDAGPGAVGPAHEGPVDRMGMTCTEDRRRDSIVLWLQDHGGPVIAAASGRLARMLGASRTFSVEARELIDVARDALVSSAPPGPLARLLPPPMSDAESPLVPLRSIAGAVDRLRADPAFLESAGTELQYRLPSGMLSHYVPSEPAAAWALNLALLAHGPLQGGAPPVPGLVTRALFHAEAEAEDLLTALIDGATQALTASYARIEMLRRQLDRGAAALSEMSRNSRAREAWLLLAALRVTSRAQLSRALALSRAGADIQARALAGAGLAATGPIGRIDWQEERLAERDLPALDDLPLRDAAAALDATMADIDRLLSRVTA